MTSHIIMLISLIFSLFSLNKTSELDLNSLISIANQIEQRIPDFIYPKDHTITIGIGNFNIKFTNLLLLIDYDDRKAFNIIKDEIHYYKIQLTLMFSMSITYLSSTNPIELKRTCGSFEAKASDFLLVRQEDNSFKHELSSYVISQSISKGDWMEYDLFEGFEKEKDNVYKELFQLMNSYLTYSIREYPLAYAEYHFKDFVKIIANHNDYEFTFIKGNNEQRCLIRFTNPNYLLITKLDSYNSLFNDFTMNVTYEIGLQNFKTHIHVDGVMFGQTSIILNRFSKTPLIDGMMVENIKKIFKKEFDKFNYEERYSIPIW